MGKIPPILLTLTVAAAVGARTNKPERATTPQGADQSAKLAEPRVYTSPDFLTAEGVWRADNLNERTELPLDAVTRLECYKHGGDELVGAAAYCMEATAKVLPGGMPDIEVEYYPVTTWDRDKVIAADSSTAPLPICVWTQITVNLQDHSIMATDTRKLSKGHEGLFGSCKDLPLAQTYHLMDKVEELVRRQLRAARLSKEEKPSGRANVDVLSKQGTKLSSEAENYEGPDLTGVQLFAEHLGHHCVIIEPIGEKPYLRCVKK